MSPTESRKLSLAKLWVLMVTAFVDMIGFALIVPLLPFYATDFGADAFTEMAIGIAFPVLKPAIEEQVRRATVKITWSEGSREHSFDVVQFLVAEQPPVVPTP